MCHVNMQVWKDASKETDKDAAQYLREKVNRLGCALKHLYKAVKMCRSYHRSSSNHGPHLE